VLQQFTAMNYANQEALVQSLYLDPEQHIGLHHIGHWRQAPALADLPAGAPSGGERGSAAPE